MIINQEIVIKDGVMRKYTEKNYIKIMPQKHGIEVTYREKPGANTYRFDRDGIFRFPRRLVELYSLHGTFIGEWIAKDSFVIHTDLKAGKKVPKYPEWIQFKNTYSALDLSQKHYEVLPVYNDGSISIPTGRYPDVKYKALDIYFGNSVYCKITPLTESKFNSSSLPTRNEVCEEVGTRFQYFAGYGYHLKSASLVNQKVILGQPFLAKCPNASVRLYCINDVLYITPNNTDEITGEEIHEETLAATKITLCEEANEFLKEGSEDSKVLGVKEVILMMQDMVKSYVALSAEVLAQKAEIQALTKELKKVKNEQEYQEMISNARYALEEKKKPKIISASMLEDGFIEL